MESQQLTRTPTKGGVGGGGDTARAARLMVSMNRLWNTFGIEPEEMDYATMTIVHPGYPLRPESIESAYYLHVLTGDPRWRPMGGAMVDALDRVYADVLAETVR